MGTRNQIKPWQRILILCLLIFGLVSNVGCIKLNTGQRKVIFVPHSTGMVRLGEDVKGHVYTFHDGEWVLSTEPVTLPAGWFAGSVSEGDSK